MESTRPLEDEVRRRLRAELDAMDIWTPARKQRARSVGYFWMARPLAIALIASLALGALAAAVTKSPDPAQWVQPAAWQRALEGPAPAPTSENPAAPPQQVIEPSGSPAPVVTEQPTHESEPYDSPSPRPRASDSPDGASREGAET